MGCLRIFGLNLIFILNLSIAFAEPTSKYIAQSAVEIHNSRIPESIVKEFQKYKVIAIGEHHGTDKIPLLVADLALSLAKSEKVILGLEIERANQKGIDKYLETGDEAILDYLAHFAREYQDGRSSKAMVELLRKIRGEKKISILAFDPDFSSDSQNRDTKMAEILLSEMQKRPNHRFLVLAGNVHSSIKKGNYFDPDYRPMAYELINIEKSPLSETDVLSVITRYESAKIWACFNDKAEDCGEMELRIPTSNYNTAVNFESYFLKESQQSVEGYNATLFFRRVNVSEPYCIK